MADVRDLLAHLLRRPRADVVLELVDLVVEAVDHREELLGDLVEEVVQVETGRRVVAERGLADRADVAGGAALRGLAHGDEAVEGRDDVDLVDGGLGVVVDRGEHEHAEHVVAVGFEPGAGLVVVHRWRAQAGERGRVHLGGRARRRARRHRGRKGRSTVRTRARGHDMGTAEPYCGPPTDSKGGHRS